MQYPDEFYGRQLPEWARGKAFESEGDCKDAAQFGHFARSVTCGQELKDSQFYGIGVGCTGYDGCENRVLDSINAGLDASIAREGFGSNHWCLQMTRKYLKEYLQVRNRWPKKCVPRTRY